MHMADALISPVVGGTMWAASAGLIAASSRKLNDGGMATGTRVPMMGVLGAFIFAAQMINFTIPGTGSSGHLGGGMILSILLGPWAGFLVMASVLTVQALFFADGGLLSLGCNIFNLGFFTCFIAYPFIYRPLAGQEQSRNRIIFASILAAVIGLQLGSLGVVSETLISGRTDLSATGFLLLMQPVHLAIGLVEGVITALVVVFIRQAGYDPAGIRGPVDRPSGVRPVMIGLVVATVLIGGIASWFASGHPDGLEWSLFRVTGTEELAENDEGVAGALAHVQEKTAVLPDYGFKSGGAEGEESESAWPAVDAGTTTAGLTGSLLVFLIIGAVWMTVRLLKRSAPDRT